MPDIYIDSTPIILLCHFCELHGPSVVFSTCLAKFHSSSQHKLSIDYFINSDRKTVCDGCSLLTTSSTSSNNYTQTSELCSTASELASSSSHSSSFKYAFNGYVTYDEKFDCHYITTDEPICYKTQMKHSCVRSLSCETYPNEREGTIYYGDDVRWHHLSWLFVLQDERARGFTRTYSIIISQSKKYDLVMNWNRYGEYVSEVISYLKRKSEDVFATESSNSKDRQRQHQQQAQMMQMQQMSGDNRMSQSFGYPSNMNTNFMDKLQRHQKLQTKAALLSQKRRTKEARSLIDLTDDPLVFEYMHRQFCYILQDLAELNCHRVPAVQLSRRLSIPANRANLRNGRHIVGSSQRRTSSGARLTAGYLPAQAAETGGTPRVAALSLRHLYALLGKDKFKVIAHNVIIGNEIVVVCRDVSFLRQFLHCLTQLLPTNKCSTSMISSKNARELPSDSASFEEITESTETITNADTLPPAVERQQQEIFSPVTGRSPPMDMSASSDRRVKCNILGLTDVASINSLCRNYHLLVELVERAHSKLGVSRQARRTEKCFSEFSVSSSSYLSSASPSVGCFGGVSRLTPGASLSRSSSVSTFATASASVHVAGRTSASDSASGSVSTSSSSSTVPTTATASAYSPQLHRLHRLSSLSISSLAAASCESTKLASHYQVTLHTNLKLAKCPQFLLRLVDNIRNVDVSDNEFCRQLANLKQQWTAYARLVASLKLRESSDGSEQLPEPAAQVGAGNKLSIKNHVNSLLKLADADLQVIEYWADAF